MHSILRAILLAAWAVLAVVNSRGDGAEIAVIKPFEMQERVAPFKVWHASVGRLAISPDGKLLLCSCMSGYDKWKGTIRIYDFKSKKHQRDLGLHLANVDQIVFSADSRLVASASMDQLLVRDMVDQKLRARAEVKNLPYRVEKLKFLRDGKRLATAAYWDNPNDEEGGLVSGIDVWDMATGKALSRLEAKGRLEFTPDGSLLVALNWVDNELHLWDVATGKKKDKVHPLPFEAGLFSIAVSPDGKKVAMDASTSHVGLIDIASGKALKSEAEHDNSVDRIVFSPDGKLLATCSDDATAKIWNVSDLKLLQTLKGHDGTVLDAAFSPDSKSIATAGADGTLRIWNVSAEMPLKHGKNEGATAK